MAQFDIYPGTGGCDYLIELQDDLLDGLNTRVVAPLASPEAVTSPMRILNPRILIDGNPYVLLTHLLAAVPTKLLGQSVGSAQAQRDAIIGSIDILFTGV